MAGLDEQLKEMEAELKLLQDAFDYKIDGTREQYNFILESKAHQFAITNLICSILAKQNNTTLLDERQRYQVFKSGKMISVLKTWLEKYGSASGSPPPRPSSN